LTAQGGMSNSIGTAFLHEMRTPAGQKRLVAIDAFDFGNGTISLMSRVFSPGDPLHEPREIYAPMIEAHAPIPIASKVRAGLVDTNDPTHFLFTYERDGGETVTLDGWIKYDDSILIEERVEPTPPPPPSSAPSR